MIDAAYKGNADKVRALLDQGTDINQRTHLRKQTALMKAAQKGRIEVVKLLLERGADKSLVDSFGRTALIIAAENGRHDIAESLVDKT